MKSYLLCSAGIGALLVGLPKMTPKSYANAMSGAARILFNVEMK
jgi:hypothetical protein